MLRNIFLHGHLKKFGTKYEIDCVTPAEGVRALIYQIPGFRKALEKGEYRVRVINNKRSLDLEAETLTLDIDNAESIHITPVPSGKKRGGLKAIVGLILITIAVIATGGAAIALGGFSALFAGGYGYLALLGASLVLSGVAMMLSPVPKLGKEKRNESFLFNGAENTYRQGDPIPLVYGRHLVGSVTVSAGVSTESAYASVNNPYYNPYGGFGGFGGGDYYLDGLRAE